MSRVTSGGSGYTLGASIAFAYLPDRARGARDALRSTCSASASTPRSSDEPLFDPKGERIRA